MSGKRLRWFVHSGACIFCFFMTMSGVLGQPDEKISDDSANLISMLHSGSPTERAYAANRFGRIAIIKISLEAIPHLITLLGDDTNYRDDRKPPLLPYATSDVPTPGWEAAQALAKFGPPAVQPLIRELQQGTTYSRQMATFALGNLRRGGDNPEVVEALAGALNDHIPEVRSESAKALGVRAGRITGGRNWMNTDMRIPKYLLPRLHNEDAAVRYEVTRALGFSNSDEVREPLFECMQKDSDPKVRTAAILALGELGDIRVITALLDLVQKEPNSTSQTEAAHILARMKYQQAFDGLKTILQVGNLSARLEAVYALSECHNPGVVDLLIATLNDDDPGVRAKAAQDLESPLHLDTRAVAPLIALLKDKDAFVRSCTASTLGELKDARAIHPLLTLLQDVDQNVRIAAKIALDRLRKISEMSTMSSTHH